MLRPLSLRRLFTTLALLLLAAGSAWADCGSPSAKAGAAIFNTTTKTMQYCNGTNWVNTGLSDPSAAQTGCTTPVGKAGTVVYVTNTGVVQFCNGSSWVDTACASKRNPGGSGCTTPAGRPGAIIYATSANEMQFCDSTNWVAMGWPCGITATDPTVLKASDAAINSYFGHNMYFNGDNALIAAPYSGGGAGQAYVFTRTNGVWAQQGSPLVNADPTSSDRCGLGTANVKIDGDTALIGCSNKNSGQGAAYVFIRSGTTWSQQAKLLPSDPTANKYFGTSTALSGNLAFIGAYGDNGGAGAVYVFSRSGSTWTQQAKITYTSTANDSFGYYLSFDNSSGTNTLMISAYEIASTYRGSVYIYTGSGSSWSLQQKLNHPNPVNTGYFGRETSITSNTAVIGSYNSTNAAYIFTRSGSTWTQRAMLTASDVSPSSSFGEFVRIISNTTVTSTIMVGGGTNRKAYIYTGNGSSWTETKRLAHTGVTNNYPYKMDMTSGTVAVGLAAMTSNTGQVKLLTP